MLDLSCENWLYYSQSKEPRASARGIQGYFFMKYEIILSPEAAADFKVLKANIRAAVRDAIEKHLRFEPTKESKSRIKKLRGIRHPQYRLRVDEIRVFYDIHEDRVEVLAIVDKSQAVTWLKNIREAK